MRETAEDDPPRAAADERKGERIGDDSHDRIFDIEREGETEPRRLRVIPPPRLVEAGGRIRHEPDRRYGSFRSVFRTDSHGIARPGASRCADQRRSIASR